VNSLDDPQMSIRAKTSHPSCLTRSRRTTVICFTLGRPSGLLYAVVGGAEVVMEDEGEHIGNDRP
jgi:hypothetical protein